jgi:mannosyltransferase
MASGTAVITSQAGAWPDIIRNGIDGYCLSTHNISDVCAVFDSMLADLDKTHEMGRVAREYMAKEYSVSREAKQLTQFLKTLVAPATEN